MTALYAAVINPGVQRLPAGVLGVMGEADNPSAILFSAKVRPPAFGTIFTSGPTATLPLGLVSKVTSTRRSGGRLVVSLAAAPVTEAVPELSFTGSLQLAPQRGSSPETGSSIPAESASVRLAHTAKNCGPPSLLKFGAHLDSIELRQAFIGAWPPQMKLTLAARTTETLGVGIAAIGINCDWNLAEIGPYSAGIPIGPIVVPVYATLPLKADLHVNGTLEAGAINVASTTVAHAAAGWDETDASLSEQGSNEWLTGTRAVSGSVQLSASIGIQAGIGIAKGANLHLEAGFGPEFDWSTGHNCELFVNLGSLSAGVEAFGHSFNTPSFTASKLHLWSGCQPKGSGSGGGSGGSAGSSGGSGGGSGGSGGAGGPTDPVGGIPSPPWSWSAPDPIDQPIGGLLQTPTLTSVSCPSLKLCVGVDYWGDVVISTDPTGGASGWTTAWVLPDRDLNSVSCPSVSLCVAVGEDGDIATSTDPTGGASAWSTTGPGPPLTAVACPSTTLCVAIGQAALVSTEPTGGPGAWTTTQFTTGPPGEPFDPWSISCPTTTFCAGVGAYGEIGTTSDPAGGASTWTAVSTGQQNLLGNISCTSSSLCAVAAGVLVVSTDPLAGAWTVSHLDGTVGAVQCLEASLCVASGFSSGSGALFTSTNPSGGPSAWAATPATFGWSGQMSCYSTSLCVGAESLDGVLISTNPRGGSTAWSASGPISPERGLTAISCPSTALCVAINASGDVVTSTTPTAGANTWTEIPVFGLGLDDIACPSTELCVAVDGSGNVVASRNPTGGPSAWSTYVPGSFGSSGGRVSCSSVHFCAAIDADGDVLTSNDPGDPTDWVKSHILSGFGSDTFTEISCPSETFCAAVDSDGNLLTIGDLAAGGTDWVSTSLPSHLNDIVCPTATLCVATSNDGVVTSTDPTGGASKWIVTGPDGENAVSCQSAQSCIVYNTNQYQYSPESPDAYTSSDPTGGANAWEPSYMDSRRSRGPDWISCPTASLCLATAGASIIVGTPDE